MNPGQVRLLAAIAVAALGMAWGAVLARDHLEGRASPLDRIEAILLDIRYLVLGPRPAPKGVVVIALDDETVAAFRRFPVSRTHLAEIVDALVRAGARAVALDILLVDPGDPAEDRRLEEALGRAPAVIAAAAIFGRDAASSGTAAFAPDTPQASRALWPAERFGERARIGLVNVSTDHAGSPRHVPMMIAVGPDIHTSLGLQAALMGGTGTLTETAVTLRGVTTSLDLGRHLVLHFYGPRGTVETVSALAVLRGETAASLDGRIAVIGVTATGAGDTFKTPFDPVLPGVEVLASAISHLIHGDALMRTASIRRFDAAMALMLPALAALLVLQQRIAVGVMIAATLCVTVVATATAALALNIWLSIGVPLAALVPTLVLAVAARLSLDQMAGRRLVDQRTAYRLFHPTVISDALEQAPDFLAQPVRQHVAILFVDLSGFTGLSERLGPEQTRKLLVALHRVVDDVVTARRGVVTSYMGDGAMVIFGLPKAAPDDAARAVFASTELFAGIRAWIAALPEPERPDSVRIGAHFGDVVVSRLGGASHQHITATGDSVNVASRLLGSARGEGGAIAFSQDLLDAAGSQAVESLAPRLGPVQVTAIRGRRQPVSVRLWREAGA